MVLGLEFGMVFEMVNICSEMVAGMVSQLEMASGMPVESKLIGHVYFKEIHNL
jgi:hypothetical protein